MPERNDERILVTGGAGFIGSHLCERLVFGGSRVHCLDDFNPYYDPRIKEQNLSSLLEHPDFSLTRGTILDPDVLERVFEWNPTLVIHLAALAGVRPSIRSPVSYLHVNVVGTANILQQCVRSGVMRLLFASSSSVYGDRQQVPFREDERVDDPESPYAASKKAGELLCYTFHRLYRMDISCLRFFTVYGPRQRPEMAIHRFVDAIFKGEAVTLFGDGTSSRDYTYIDDCIDGIIAAVAQLHGYEVYNLGESTSIRLNELVDTIEQVIGRQALRTYLPEQPGDVRATYACIDKARRELGYQPKIGLKEGIQRFVDWHQAKG